MERPNYELIQAAVNGDEEAMEKIIKFYEPMIDAECGGNRIIRHQIIIGLREAILHYDLNDPKKNEAYLREHYPDAKE